MFGSKKENNVSVQQNVDEAMQATEIKENSLLDNKVTLKDLLSPSGIDASHPNHLEIVSHVSRYARSMYAAALPRMCTFPNFLRSMYNFGDINSSVYIKPVPEATSQNELNRIINDLESERIVAADGGDINRERLIAQKRVEAEALRDEIAARI